MAVGANGAAVLLQFLAEAVMLSTAGGALGVIVSFAGASAIGRMLGWSLEVPIEALAVASLVAATVGVVFGYLPARSAARLDPIVALRDET